MFYSGVVLFSALVVGSNCADLKLPSWFQFGAGTSAFQIEGGWNASDKSESVWDRQLHLFPATLDGNADVACDSYHLWRRDIEMAEELGLDMYRFSISWSRLLPTGFSNYISEDGKRYYSDLIDGLLEKGIEPVVTIHHFDLPQRIQDLGGWANPLIADWFSSYANVVFSLFGNRVKYWLTINEPLILCDSGYTNQTVPYLDDKDIGRYLCNKNVLIAHAKAYRIYEKEYKPIYNGKVSIVNLFVWLQPATPHDKDITDLTIQYWEGRYGHAIYSKEGGWPKELENFLLEKGRSEGYPSPRLPPFTDEEVALVKGSADFYAFNHYSTRLVRKAKPGEEIGSWPILGSQELGIVLERDPSWEIGDTVWFSVYPQGLRNQLNFLKETYGDLEFLITENGFFSTDPSLNDTRTVDYTWKYLEQVALAIQDGVNVTGYIHWSLMDNFDKGYSAKFGLYSVDFNDPNRTRTPRASARYYSKVTRTHCPYPEDEEEK
nr:myrosinase 1 [Helicoverpa armigera]